LRTAPSSSRMTPRPQRGRCRRPPAQLRWEPVNGLRSMRARLWAANPRLVDLAIAGGFALAMVVEDLSVESHGKSRVLSAVFGIALAACMAFRRRAPEASVIAFSAVLLVEGPVPDDFVFDNTTMPFVAVLFTFYSLGRHVVRLWPALAIYLAAVAVAIAFTDGGFTAGDAVWIAFMFGLPLLAGRTLRSRHLLQRELREKALSAEAERRRRAQRATEAERDRIAAELQAVVANGVSAMVVQAEAVPRVLAGGDTARAADSLAVIEETGRDALIEMRRLLGVLRRDDEGPALAPQPGLGRLDALVERQRRRGIDVELTVEGEARPLSPGIDLTAYRVLEDGLEAALEQEARSARVLVRYGQREVELEVRDDRSGGPSNRLASLRARVGLYGGHLSADREDGAGFALRVRMPLEEVAA
jgi:signal transduction histidine kinase